MCIHGQLILDFSFRLTLFLTSQDRFQDYGWLDILHWAIHIRTSTYIRLFLNRFFRFFLRGHMVVDNSSVLVSNDLVFSKPGDSIGAVPPWLVGSPPNWQDDSNSNFSTDCLLDKFHNRDPTLLQFMWGSALGSSARQKYLRCFQGILHSLMNCTKKQATFDRYAMLICFHLQIIVASLDIRATRSHWLSNYRHRPAQWFRMIHAGIHPDWIRLILNDLGQWSTIVGRLSSAAQDGSIIYAMWSLSDFYVGKANVTRYKGQRRFAGCPARLMEHWEGLCLKDSKSFSRPRYKIFRRQSWSDIRFLPISFVPSRSMSRHIETFVIKALDPSANKK